jgi:hypothetical protein
VVELIVNGHRQSIASLEELEQELHRFHAEPQFELSASVPDGSSICMLRNGEHAWLMYLRHDEDSGFNSVGNQQRVGVAQYILSNGQTDEYPLAWCIEVEQCYRAVVYFFVTEGARPEWVNWHET